MAKEELDKVNFENLVWFYSDELALLYNGTRAREIFPKGLRRRLLKLGVIVYRHGRSGLRYLLSSATQELLQSITSTPL